MNNFWENMERLEPKGRLVTAEVGRPPLVVRGGSEGLERLTARLGRQRPAQPARLGGWRRWWRT